MNRFFVNVCNVLEDEQKIIIDNPDDIKHITKVLRLSVDDEIEICNMENVEYGASILSINKNLVECRINNKYLSKTEAPIEIVLFQAMPKSSKMDLIVQKSVEIGVSKIVPIISERCVVKVKDKASETKKINRWQKIALEAAKQCKRGIIPKIGEIIEIKELYGTIKDFDLLIMPYEEEKNITIKHIISNKDNVKKVGIIIGPEGGFLKEEVLEVVNQGGLSVSLGPRILRTETAGLAAAVILMYELGDLGGN